MRHNELGFCNLVLDLHFARRRLAGVERRSRASQFVFNIRCDRMRTAEHAPRSPCRALERFHGLADIVERGAGVLGVMFVPRSRTRLSPALHTQEFVFIL